MARHSPVPLASPVSSASPVSFASRTSRSSRATVATLPVQTPSLRKPSWRMLAVALATVVASIAFAPRAHAQNTAAPSSAGTTNSAAAGVAPGQAINPSADISRAVSRDMTDTAIQNNWNSIMHPPVQARPEDKPAESPRRGRRGITPGISTN
ncbi:hypothetical protein [Pandoraea pnomenusa]|uniref:hypothetical protein n=1 Tax=Pandoraea pnomenusa TaxID=93220 RepID=UPI00130EE592|nr:hypothetical protein [Pandoraea pnomenusa]